jgi:hypothetical protein
MGRLKANPVPKPYITPNVMTTSAGEQVIVKEVAKTPNLE